MFDSGGTDRRKKKRAVIRLRKSVAVLTLKEGETPLEVNVILNDFSTLGIGVYCRQYLSQGEKVTLTLSDPVDFSMEAEVAWVEEVQNYSKVISENAIKFRVGLKFLLDSKEAEEKVNVFADELRSHNIFGSGLILKKKKDQSKKKEGDDLDVDAKQSTDAADGGALPEGGDAPLDQDSIDNLMDSVSSEGDKAS